MHLTQLYLRYEMFKKEPCECIVNVLVQKEVNSGSIPFLFKNDISCPELERLA